MASVNSWCVLTGGPCAGKTTLINALQEKGYRTIPEAARMYIEQGLAQGKAISQIRADEVAFQREVLRMKMFMEAALPRDERIFFDRGMHDSVAYFDMHGVAADEELAAAVSRARYEKAFLLDIVPYVPDGARTETLEQAKHIHERLGRVYAEVGIPVIQVPVLPVPERMQYILDCL